jgi:hypothetical protein
MITLDFLFSPEIKFCMEQAGALKCGLLPVIHKTLTSMKMHDYNSLSLMLFSRKYDIDATDLHNMFHKALMLTENLPVAAM